MMNKDEFMAEHASTLAFISKVDAIKATIGTPGSLTLSQLESLAPQFEKLIQDEYDAYVAENS
jgi:hypothetical protein